MEYNLSPSLIKWLHSRNNINRSSRSCNGIVTVPLGKITMKIITFSYIENETEPDILIYHKKSYC